MTDHSKILVLGGTGFLGRYIASAFGDKAIVHTTSAPESTTGQETSNFYFSNNQNDRVKKFLETQDCGTIINCVALADIERCESDPETAYWINSELPGIVSKYSRSRNIKFVQISTDAVFDGSTSYRTEHDKPSPLSVYGKSKLSGEQLVMANNPGAIIARVNFFGKSPKGNSLFDFFYNNLRSGVTVSGFTDVYFTPLYAGSLAEVVVELLKREQTGIFHLTGDERISKFDFGVLIAEAFNFSASMIEPNTMAKRKMADIRSLDLSLANDKIRSLGINLPSVRDGLAILKSTIS